MIIAIALAVERMGYIGEDPTYNKILKTYDIVFIKHDFVEEAVAHSISSHEQSTIRIPNCLISSHHEHFQRARLFSDKQLGYHVELSFDQRTHNLFLNACPAFQNVSSF